LSNTPKGLKGFLHEILMIGRTILMIGRTISDNITLHHGNLSGLTDFEGIGKIKWGKNSNPLSEKHSQVSHVAIAGNEDDLLLEDGRGHSLERHLSFEGWMVSDVLSGAEFWSWCRSA
jgi:hypothetical protein